MSKKMGRLKGLLPESKDLKESTPVAVGFFGLLLALVVALAWYATTPPITSLGKGYNAPPSGFYELGDGYTSTDALPSSTPPLQVMVDPVNYNTGRPEVVVIDVSPPRHCGFAERHYNGVLGCRSVTIPIGAGGSVWRIACQLGRCRWFGRLCLLRGDAVLYPGKINYRRVLGTDRVISCP